MIAFLSILQPSEPKLHQNHSIQKPNSRSIIYDEILFNSKGKS
jgi:hypothetical protein